MRQQGVELTAKLLLLQKVTPHNQAAVSGEPLIGKANSSGRRSRVRVHIQAHRLVRLRLR